MSKKTPATSPSPPPSSADPVEIINFEVGFQQIKTDGIDAFISFVESRSRAFFRAKEFVKLYDVIFKMAIQHEPYNWSDRLYHTGFSQSIRDYLSHSARPLLQRALDSHSDETFLKEWTLRWTNFKMVDQGLTKLFMYLNRYYVPSTDGALPLMEQGFKIFRESMFDHFSGASRASILRLIERERGGETVDRSLLQQSVKVFEEMGSLSGRALDVYKKELEAYVLEHASQYYARTARQQLDQDSMPLYLEKAERQLQAERQRVEAFLNRTTMEGLSKVVYVNMLQTHQDELLRKKTGLMQLLAIVAHEDLKRMYRLYKVDTRDLDPIANMFSEYVQKVGLDVVEKAKSGGAAATGGGAAGGEEGANSAGGGGGGGAAAAPPSDAPGGGKNEEGEGSASSSSTSSNAAAAPAVVDSGHMLVSELISLHQRYNDVVVQCFEKAQLMQKALKRAFEDFINKDARVSKLLAKYVNDVLKKSNKINVKDVESTLDNIVFLYGYIQEKDVFERDYQIYLAHRLLNGLCESEHSEKTMIAKLKTECGYQWTNKLEGMFKDVQLSKEMMGEFRRMYQNNNNPQPLDSDLDIALDVNVCTTGYWPSTKAIPTLKHPKELIPICEKFKRFYLNAHSGHKLEWRLEQGQSEISIDFDEAHAAASRRTLVLSTYQMMVMLLFNSFKILTFKQMCDMTGIPKDELANPLLSLCHPKVNVLLKNPNNRSLEDSHKFMINGQYKNPLKRVVVPTMTIIANLGEGEKTSELVELQRRHQMDASIVRIMKTRKTLKHPLLMAEVAQQLQARFKPKPDAIKKRIEALIEQEYLERDKDDRSIYHYLA